jgi:hypothetical protein
MAHYVAELILNATHKNPRTHAARRDVCFKAILDLWHHRYGLPEGSRPFSAIGPVVRALESLDPDRPRHRYFPVLPPPEDNSKDTENTRRWIALANDLDRTARFLVLECLKEAAASAIDKTADWVDLAARAGADDIELRTLRIIIEKLAPQSSGDDASKDRSRLKDRANRLRMVAQHAVAAANDLDHVNERQSSQSAPLETKARGTRSRSGSPPPTKGKARPPRKNQSKKT